MLPPIKDKGLKGLTEVTDLLTGGDESNGVCERRILSRGVIPVKTVHYMRPLLCRELFKGWHTRAVSRRKWRLTGYCIAASSPAGFLFRPPPTGLCLA
ncbi:unnamed protein product, partial [Iphiclides podalirius]